MAQLKLENLSVSFAGVTALSEVGFAIGNGQRVGLIGESGAGKSVIALAIAGLLPADAKLTGTIRLDDQQITAAAAATLRGTKIGLLLQDAAASLDPLRTARQHLRDALPPAPDLDARVETALTEIGYLPARAALYPEDLDPGEQQLLALAMVLAPKPDLLIADDPAGWYDLPTQRRILDLIDRHCGERGMSLLLIVPDIKAVALLCTRIVVLHQGRVVESGEKSDVLGHPKHEFTRSLLSAGRNRARTLMRTPIGGTLLEVRDLRKRFRRPNISLAGSRPPVIAVDDLSFTMRAGESMAMIGPSGAGKTTLARIVAGLERASKGELEYDDRVYHGPDLSLINRGDITMIFRDPRESFNPRLTMAEFVAEPLRLDRDGLMDELSGRMIEVITAVGLVPNMLQRLPGELRLGELYRFSIARALITRPKLVVIDEPVAVLDIASRNDVLVLLNRLRADFGLTFLVACSDIDTARVIADRVLIMDQGRIVETGTPASLLEKPQHETTKRLVAAALPETGVVPVF